MTALWAQRWSAACLAVVLSASPAVAQEDAADLTDRLQALEDKVERLGQAVERNAPADDTEGLRTQIEALTRELERLRLGQEVVPVADESKFGLGPAASRVYAVQQGVSIGGYGEMLYQNFASTRQDDLPSGRTDRFDFVRAILYVGYKFDDRFVFNSEIEVEHASTGQTGSVSLEFAYLDFMISDAFNLRAGLVLPPMGFINELHEPPTFLSSERPETERRIIPSTWRENGLGFFGESGPLSYRAFLVTGFDGVGGGGSDADGFSSSGLRGGRQKGSRADADDFALTGRLDYKNPHGVMVGTSAYVGNSGQGNADPFLPGETLGARTFIWEGHAQAQVRGLSLRGLLSVATVDDVPQLNALRGLVGGESIGERLTGGYVEGGYDVLNRSETQVQFIPFVRYERLNTQSEVPAGFSADPASDRTLVTIGADLKPVPNIVFKTDYVLESNDADTGVNRFNISLGYLF
ncbi:MAG: bZIP transcription factor [Gemmatimonadota bacterium]